MNNKVVLNFAVSRYGRKGSKAFTIFKEDWDPRVTCWIWPAMEQLEKTLNLTPASITMWDQLRHAIPDLIHVFCWQGFTSIPFEELEFEVVRDLFMDIDDTFHRLYGPDIGALRSSRLRQFLNTYLLAVRPDGALSRVKGSFTPKTRSRPQPRALISDQISRQTNASVREPVGALPHANSAQLRAMTKTRLKADFEFISAACCHELAAFEKACAVVEAMRNARVDSRNEKRAMEKIQQSGRLEAKLALLTVKERAALLAYFIRLDSAAGASFSAPSYKGSSFLEEELCRSMEIEPLTFLRCSRYRYYPHQYVLVAAIVLIQIHTAWNVSSVMELKARKIQKLGPSQYLVQSLKSKTSDDTPQVLLEGDDNPAVIAIRFALNRLREIKARGWADDGEDCLWLSPRSNYDSSRGLPISNLAHGLKKLISLHALPQFTFEQIRTQALTIISLDKGPIAAAEAAGHGNFGSIGGYIDHLVTRRINSALSLEFEKRWEREVAQRILLGPQPHSLMPVGDGTSCVDPEDPPDETWFKAGFCSAEHCHEGEGCRNRVLVINQLRIKEVMLTHRYYETSWQRLYADNPQAFEAIHMPRMEFNIYLHAYLKKGPYRSLINDQS